MYGRYFSLLITILFLFNNINAQDEFEFKPGTTIGGYGELHYNYEKPENGTAKKTLDFHRFVLFYGYNWTENWSLKAEVELEHNFVEEGQGAVELEQAYINYHHADWFGFQVGVILPSVGLLNEYHEPPTFLSVERPDYHNKIIPTTWFGNGAAIYGSYEGFSYKAAVMEGFNADGFSAGSGVRGGRQQGFKSDAENLLYNLRIDYLNVPGLKVGASFVYNNANGETVENAVTMIEGHAQYNANNIISTFEIGNISYDKGNVEQSLGYYFDFGYDVASILNSKMQIIPFIRLTQYNTAASSPLGSSFEDQYKVKKWMIGLSLKPISSVVFKVDYAVKTSGTNDTETNLFNLGAGYMF